MKIGDIIECAIWMDGTETPEQRKEHEGLVIFNIEKLCEQEGFVHGTVQWKEKHPMEDKVPEVPDHIQGPKVRLLVAEAKVVDVVKIEDSKGSFIANLDKKDLEKLRKITKQAWAKDSGEILSDAQADKVIERIGPEAALDTLRVFH